MTCIHDRLVAELKIAPRGMSTERSREIALHLLPALRVELMNFRHWTITRGIGHKGGVEGLVTEYVTEAFFEEKAT